VLVGDASLAPSSSIVPGTTVRLINEVRLNGQVIPAGSVVTVSGDAMKVVLPDGTSWMGSYAKLTQPPLALTYGETAANSASMSDILLPNGQPVGYVNPGAGRQIIRTVTSEQFGELQAQLMAGAKPTITPAGYGGTWYEMSNGSVFGIRTSSSYGTTIDVIKSNHPGLKAGFKVHKK
jgi:hypothetical protein